MSLLMNIFVFIIFIVLTVIFVFVGVAIAKASQSYKIENTDFKDVVKVKNYEKFMANYKNIMKSLESGEKVDLVEDHEIEELLHEKREVLLKKFYDIFLDVQKSLSNSDYDKLKELCTNELYNTYKSQSEALDLSKKKFVKNTYELIAEEIVDLREDNDIIEIGVLLKVLYNDYIKNTNKVDWLEGEAFTKDFAYKLTFIIGNDKEEVCPNCGASLKNTTGDKCPYCKSYVVLKPKNYTLSKVDVIE